jgi:P4 family phage/plasmid primase-like protien
VCSNIAGDDGFCFSHRAVIPAKTPSPVKVEMPPATNTETATPANPEQTIAITTGLASSDKAFDSVPVSKVEDYLRGKWNPPGVKRPLLRRKECYERTQPTESEPTRRLNRVYVDIDGEMEPDMPEDDFNAKVGDIRSALETLEGVAIKESCKWKCSAEDSSVSNKLSFTIHYKNLCGSKKAINHFVKSKVAPNLTKLLKDVIPVAIILKKESKSKAGNKYDGKAVIDLSVYNEGNRKMRMLYQTKPCQDRPYKLITGEFVDTLITYIPPGCPELPEPQSILTLTQAEEPPPLRPEEVEPSLAPTEASDPTEDDIKSREILSEVISKLGQHRWDYYPDWIRIGFVMYNEGYTVENFVDVSRVSRHFKPAESPSWIKAKWKHFRKSNFNQALLWKWLSEDDIDTYMEMALQRMDFWKLLKNPSHAETARFFYNLKPDAYLYNEKLGWFQLQPNNIWKSYEKQPNGLLADIWHTLSKLVQEHKNQINMTETDEDKAKIEAQKLKGLLGFGQKIGNKSFCDGVIAFLPSCYADEDLDKKMDESRHLLAFSDAVYDFEVMEARPIEPEDYVCLNTGFPYPTKRFAEARAELVHTIRSVYESEERISATPDVLGALTSYVLKALALCLHGVKKYEKFFVWTGTGGNGKGLIAELVKRVLGDYYHTVPHQVLTKSQDKKDAPCPPLAKAKGKRIVFATEPEADDKLQVGAIKEWTGGDVITARDLHRSTITFVPQFVLFLQTNTIPQLNRPDGGIQRRLEVIGFPHQFVEHPTEAHHKKINIDLKEKISKSLEWRSEMWFLLLDAYRLLQADGLSVPAEVTEATNGYMDDQNPIKEWLEANYTLGLDKNNRSFQIESSVLRKQFMDMTRQDIGADKFKASMESLRQTLKKESHDFTAIRWVNEKIGDEWVGTWRESVGKAGKYWVGLKRAKAPMPGIQISDE